MLVAPFVAAMGLLVVAPAAAQTPDLPAQAQPGPDTSAGRVRVFLDCGGAQGDAPDQCFSAFLREQIDFVDFVRQPQDADVQVLANSRGTGGGGREVLLRFVGRERFAGHDHELRAITTVSDTESTRREVVLRTALVGLLDYVAHDGIPAGVNISVRTEAQADSGPVVDPWNLWVFDVRLSGRLDLNERNREQSTTLNVGADRVSRTWKLSFGGRFNYNLETFDLDESEPVKVTRRDRNVDWFAARSLGRHWSAGIRGRASSSTFNNNRLTIATAPAVEYSVFPYDQYATRQLRMEYNIGVRQAQYNEPTLFGRLEETLWEHELSAVLDQRQPWGTLRAGLEYSQYLHDRSKYRLESSADLTLRLTRGLSLTFSGSASRVRDQLSLPARNATNEEILLRLRQLQSGHEVNVNFGLRYTFGSIFNNIINPRFGN